MTLPFSIEAAQAVLNELNLSGWLLYDFQGQNPIARTAVGLDDAHVTRRWFYYVPLRGEPTLILHRIETSNVPELPGRRVVYSARPELQRALATALEGAFAVAMEYYPQGAIPYLSRVDAGTVEWIRSLGVDVTSSHPLVSRLLCTWDEAQRQSHQAAVEALCEIKDEALAWLEAALGRGEAVGELEVQAQILEGMARRGLETDHPPIVAVGAHAGDPHYAPGPGRSAPIGRNHVLLIDLWARQQHPRAAYGDLTFMAWVGPDPVPERIDAAFRAVLAARDRARALVEERWAAGESAAGWEADRAARRVIHDAGFGEAFTHRTGHNLGLRSAHGDGPHLDDLETHDDRPLIANLGFTIEPGIYLPAEDFGIRSEINVFMHPVDGPTVYGQVQHDWHRLDPSPLEAS